MSINIDKIWIGETITSTRSGRVGTYEGENTDGRVRLRSEGKIYLVNKKHVTLYQEEKAINPKLEEINKTLKVKPKRRSNEEISDTIDLHIEKLGNHLINAAPQMILNHQIRKTQEFIEKAIKQGIPQITIIHGKGTGQLKLEVEYLLNKIGSIQSFETIHNGGATQANL